MMYIPFQKRWDHKLWTKLYFPSLGLSIHMSQPCLLLLVPPSFPFPWLHLCTSLQASRSPWITQVCRPPDLQRTEISSLSENGCFGWWFLWHYTVLRSLFSPNLFSPASNPNLQSWKPITMGPSQFRNLFFPFPFPAKLHWLVAQILHITRGKKGGYWKGSVLCHHFEGNAPPILLPFVAVGGVSMQVSVHPAGQQLN